MSPRSLEYARLLFEFIESSEEIDLAAVSGASPAPNGYLRRSRNAWWTNPDDQYAGGEKWGASTDELVGVIFGLNYFVRATEAADQAYNQRAKALLRRIASYLKTHRWVYADSRITPPTEENYLAENTRSESGQMISYGVGTLAFIYPFARVFEDILGDAYSIGFDEAVETAESLYIERTWDSDLMTDYLLFLLPSAGCVAELLAADTRYSGLSFGCGSVINTNREVYRLLVENAAPLTYLAEDTKGFFNHAMLTYTAWLALDSHSASHSDKAELAKKLYHYVFDMWGADYWFNWNGPGRRNMLFGALAKRAASFLDTSDKMDALNLPDRAGYVVTEFEHEIDDVLNSFQAFQPDLPLGEPALDPQGEYPWETNWTTYDYGPIPGGKGTNSAWRYADESFFMSSRSKPRWTAEDAFKELGPYYQAPGEPWSASRTLARLRATARVGYRPSDPEYQQLLVTEGLHFKFEAGGNDHLLVRMLLVDIGYLPPPVLANAAEHIPVLPVRGEGPW